VANGTIAVAMKWVDLRPEIDPITGAVHDDERAFGCSEADRAALEWALRAAERWGMDVIAVTAGPRASETALRNALATGVARGVRIDLPADAASEEVAAALSEVVAEAALVCCGDWSIDRGSGSVPALLAARLDRPQALGLLKIDLGEAGSLVATRRLDRGRREVLRIAGPAVLSFEGGSADLRRAGLAATLQARGAAIEVVDGVPVRPRRVRVTQHGPYRPRASAQPAPDQTLSPRERILALTGALVERTPPRTVVTDAVEGADLIIEQLRAWGYLDEVP
jgi:electron transfer flavoprotein beta subunit